MSYPIIEFMRWRFDSTNETTFLTILQIFIDVLPALALIFYEGILENSGFTISNGYTVTAYVVLSLGIWNYRTLRRGVFEKLVGKIKTLD